MRAYFLMSQSLEDYTLRDVVKLYNDVLCVLLDQNSRAA